MEKSAFGVSSKAATTYKLMTNRWYKNFMHYEIDIAIVSEICE